MQMTSSYFFWIMLLGLAFFVIAAAFGADNTDVHVDTDHGGAGHEGSSISTEILTVRNFFLFMTGFGASGLTLQGLGFNLLQATIFGTLGGIVLAGLGFIFFKMLKRSQGNSLVSSQNLVGVKGTVTVAIPTEGNGEISVQNQLGVLTTLMARSQGQMIKEGSRVEVLAVSGNTAIVHPL